MARFSGRARVLLASSDFTLLVGGGNPALISSLYYGLNPAPTCSIASYYSTTTTVNDAINETKTTHMEDLIQTKCKSGSLKLDEAFGFFNSLIHIQPNNNRMPTSISTFNQLLTAIYKMKQYATVVSFCKEMMGCANIKPDIVTMNILINCFCCLNRVDLGFSVLAIIFKSGLRPNTRTIATLLRGFCAKDNITEAVLFFLDIVRKGYPSNEYTYSIMMDVLCKTGNTCRSLEILGQLVERGNPKPNVVIYNIVINGLCKERHVDKALNLFQDMMNAGVAPDVVAYTSIIHGLCDFGMWKQATKLFHDMKHHGISPNVTTFTCMVDALCKEGRTTEALQLVQEMASRGIKPDLVTYTSLIHMFFHSRQ